MKTLTQNLAIRKETEKAIMVSGITVKEYGCQKTFNNIWLPKSKIEISDKYEYITGFFTANVTFPTWVLKDQPCEREYSGDNSAWMQVFRDHCE